MTISELISKLETLRKEHGDIPVRVQTLSHLWDPNPEIRDKDISPFAWVILNP